MGNISLHTTAGTTVQPFLLEGTKFEFCNAEYTNESTAENKTSVNASVKNESETNTDREKGKNNSPIAFQNHPDPLSFTAETSTSNTFSQTNYNFPSYS